MADSLSFLRVIRWVPLHEDATARMEDREFLHKPSSPAGDRMVLVGCDAVCRQMLPMRCSSLFMLIEEKMRAKLDIQEAARSNTEVRTM